MPDAGYHFVSWSDGLTSAARTDANVTADLSVTASFAADSFTSASGLTVVGKYAYIAAGADGLRIVDVSDPQAPTVVGQLRHPWDGERRLGLLAVCLRGRWRRWPAGRRRDATRLIPPSSRRCRCPPPHVA